MVNRRREEVGYRPFRVQSLLADGLLAVSRPDGDLERRVADGLFRLAETAGQWADRQAAGAGKRAGEAAALAGAPNAGDYPVGGAGRVRGAKFSADVNDAIHRASVEEGVDEGTLSQFAQIESGGNPNAYNESSGAAGLFQFIPSTARQYGLTNPRDAYQSAKAGARLLKDNAAYLRKQLGREPTPGELYLAHQQGAGGAVKLLKNPDAPASSAVGPRAVSLNGGKPGMTAGQFAAMWTQKFDGGYALPENGDQIAGAPGTSLAGGPLLTGGTFRPTNSDTIYGRAYDEAGTHAYVQMLETEMRKTTSQAFDLYKDDPVKLQKVLQDLGSELDKQHVFPEIRADFAAGYGRLAESYIEQARDNARKKAEAADRADFIERTTALSTDIERKVQQLDPKNPDTANVLAGALGAIDDHFNSAVSRGIMDPDDAARAKAEARRSTAVAFYEKQATDLDADGVKAMHAKIKADFASRGVDGLDGEGFTTLDAELTKLETDKRNAAARLDQDIRQRGDALASRAALGFDVPQADMSKLVLDAGTTPEGKAAVVETFAKISVAKQIAAMPLRQAQEHVDGLRRQYGKEATTAQLRTLAFAEDVLAEKRKAIATDPVSYAEQQGIVAETPLLTEAENTDDMAAIMTKRTLAADQAGAALGTAPRYLKAGEAKALAAYVRANPQQGAAAAAAIVQGAGDRAEAVLSEFGQDAPMVAEAGAILAFGGDARAAEDVILGYGRSPDGQQQKGLKPEAAAPRFKDVVGDAMVLAPKDRLRVSRAAASIARKRITEEGVDPASDEAGEIYDQAVQEAAGAVFDRGVQYGGFAEVNGAKVLVPPAMRADAFGDVIAAITDADLEAMPVKPKQGANWFAWGDRSGLKKGLAETLRDGVPVRVKGGYAFAYGDPASDDPQFVQGTDGKLFVLDLAAIAPALQKRVPEAFR